MSTLNISVPAAAAAAPLGYAMPDPLLRWFGPDKGFAIDFGSVDCFSRQGTPQNGDSVINYANGTTTRNGTISVVAGVTFAGNSIDFSGVTAPGNFVQLGNVFDAIESASDTVIGNTTNTSNQLVVTSAPGSPLRVGSLISGTGIPAATTITAGPSGGGVGTYTMSANATATGTAVSVTVKNKAFAALMTLKLPSAADWPSTARSISGAGNFSTGYDLMTIYMVTNGASKDLVLRFSTAATVSSFILLSNIGNLFNGKTFQLFVERTDTGATTAVLRSLDGTVTYSSNVTTIGICTASLTGMTWRFGTMTSAQINNNFSAAGSWNATDIGACKWRIGRAAILSTKGLPSTVTARSIADADYADTVARNLYS